MAVGAKTFVNANYKPEWAKTTPGGQNFDAGTYSDFSTGGGWAVYDGAGNYMGAVRPNGTLEYSGAGGTEYKDSFLQAAQKEILSGLGGQWDTSWVKGQTVSPATGETVPGTEYSGQTPQQIAAALSKAGYGGGKSSGSGSSGGSSGSGSSGGSGTSPGADAAGRVWNAQYSYGKEAPNYGGDPAKLPGDFRWDVAAPEYREGNYAEMRDALLAGLETPFSWDAETDPVWQAYQQQYQREGARAAADALGQVAAATGGVPSSYAVTAAQQAGNYYAAQLSDRLPELYQQAYERYLQEYSRKLGLADTYDALEQQEYGKYRDERGDWESDRAFAYGQHADEYARAAAENETAYQRYLDSYNQWLTERDLDYSEWMDARNLERQAEQDALERARYDAEWARLLQQDALERERYDAEWAYQLEQDAYRRALQEAAESGSGSYTGGGSSGGRNDLVIPDAGTGGGTAYRPSTPVTEVRNGGTELSRTGAGRELTTPMRLEEATAQEAPTASNYSRALDKAQELAAGGATPEEIAMLMNALREQGMLTTAEYTDIVRYMGRLRG